MTRVSPSPRHASPVSAARSSYLTAAGLAAGLVAAWTALCVI
ncbi:MAG TPA: hypothetical protein VMB34_33280 [Acetobacteraceae bacterium]|nr:hypothetical protein [Acetobacteraceae bacterium]